MDLVPTDAEVAEAERLYKTAYDADFGRGYGMRHALESFLQGRAKPLSDEQWSEAYLKGAAAGEKIAAQEEITDEQIDAIWEELPDCALVTTYSDQRRFARAIIRASKGEKT